MNIAYTDTFTVDTNGVLVARSATPGGNLIPDSISVRSISVWSSKSNGAYVDFYIKGIHSSSDWVKYEEDMPIHNLEGCVDSTSIYFYVKADSEITMNILVKGGIS